eukprot:4150455-Amphidinium_carterae.4
MEAEYSGAEKLKLRQSFRGQVFIFRNLASTVNSGCPVAFYLAGSKGWMPCLHWFCQVCWWLGRLCQASTHAEHSRDAVCSTTLLYTGIRGDGQGVQMQTNSGTLTSNIIRRHLRLLLCCFRASFRCFIHASFPSIRLFVKARESLVERQSETALAVSPFLCPLVQVGILNPAPNSAQLRV